MTTKPAPATLPGLTPPRESPGPVYQGVCAQVRALFGKAKDRPPGSEEAAAYARVAGVVAMARSLAQSVDRVSGHNGGYQASGHQLSLMHGQLLAILQALAPDAAGESDSFADLMARLNAAGPVPSTTPDDRAAAPPHSEV